MLTKPAVNTIRWEACVTLAEVAFGLAGAVRSFSRYNRLVRQLFGRRCTADGGILEQDMTR